MAQSLVVNQVTHAFPDPGDRNWGANASAWAAAVTSGMLQKAGGSFALTAEVDFGASFGLKGAYFKSRTSNPAAAGAVRLAVGDVLGWRNNANDGDLALAVDGSDQLTFGGAVVLSGEVADAQVAAGAAIALSKLAALTASRALVSDGSGVVSESSVTATELGYLSGLTSGAQAQLDAKLALSGGTMTGALTLSGSPTSSLHATTKAYVDSVAVGLQPKEAVVAATTSAGTLASDFEDGDTLDGVSLSTGDRVLIKDQADATENGIYAVEASGAPTRATEADSWDELVGASVFVSGGTSNGATSWTSTTESGGTLGVDDVVFVQTGGGTSYSADGSGIELSGTTFSLELDGSTLSKSASGLKVADLGIANAQVSASAAIALSKLATGNSYRLLVGDASGVPSEHSALTASRALATDANGLPAASAVTSAELAHLSGVTSAVQTQLDGKLSTSGGSVGGTIDATGLQVGGEDVAVDADVAEKNVVSATVAGAAASSIDIDSIPAYDLLEVTAELILDNASGTEEVGVRFNNDSGANYDFGGTSSSLFSAALTATSYFTVHFTVQNPAARPKTYEGTSVGKNGTGFEGNALGGWWDNTSGQVSRITLVSTGNGAQFQVGSRVKVTGKDY